METEAEKYLKKEYGDDYLTAGMYASIQKKEKDLRDLAKTLNCRPDEIVEKIDEMLEKINKNNIEIDRISQKIKVFEDRNK
jgi:hypothetical protein